MSVIQAQGMLFGLALGDALGWPTEFKTLEQIRAVYGPEGIQEPPDPAIFTDDTQMTIALAEGLLEAGDSDLDTQMQAVGRWFVTWMNSPENNRAPGNTCMAGVGNFQDGAPWRVSGVASSKGCGSAMRVAPVGYLYQQDEARLAEIARASSLITHGHPAAVIASAAAAYLVKLALDGVHPADYLARLFTFTAALPETEQTGDFEAALRRVGHVLGWGSEVMAMQHIGEGWVGEEAVALALYCVMRYPDDYIAAVRRGANSSGDSDSIACIAGGILGARLGGEAIPVDWRDRCEKRDYLAELGKRLAAERAGVGGAQPSI